MPQPVIFEHYEVLTRDDGSLYELGRGAMGVTYKAFDTSLRVPVALKVINATYLNSEIARQRFVREAQSAAKLRHRNVATVYHLGTEQETWFYAMEFIDGETVDALVRRHGPLEPTLALQIAAQVCRALNAAMPHGLVHRDIKPANLMLVREDEELVVKVIDFGLALNVHGEEAVTEAGFVGTPHFASPEQLSNAEVDVRSDLYSLGVTLWFMLAGRTPFSGSAKQVARQHLSQTPPFESIEAQPEPVLAVLRKVLEKEPASRHQTPQEFRRALEEAASQIAGDDAGASSTPTVADDLFERQDTVAETAFEAGGVVADRYKITRFAGETNLGRTFRCYDREQQRDVRLVLLHAQVAGDAYTQIEREIERLVPLAHDNLLRVYEFATMEGVSYLVLEWTEGFTLLELLRARRELAAAETLALLQQAARGVDHALQAGLTHLDFALHQIAIHFPQTIDREKLLRTPLLTWPAFALKLNPLGSSPELAAGSQTWAGGQTMVGTNTPAPREGDGRTRAVQALAAVAYELLGGTTGTLHGSITRLGDPHRYTPIATLSEEGNDVLRRALDPDRSYASAEEFYQALKGLAVLGVRAPTITAPSLALSQAELASSSPVTRRPAAPAAPVRRRFPVKFLGGLLTVLAIGAGAYFLAPREQAPLPSPAHLAVEEATPPVTPPPADDPPTPPATSPATTPVAATPNPAEMARAQALRQALGDAEAAERSGDAAAAITAWLRVAREYPEDVVARRRLDFAIDPLRNRPELRTPESFSQLKPLLIEAAQFESVAAALLLGEGLRGTNLKESFAWFSLAADKGRTEAALQVGLMLSNGVDGDQPDFERAFYYFAAAAKGNDPAAKNLLAECYLLGKGTKPNPELGLRLLREAADQGNLRAINRLAGAYARGLFGFSAEPQEAFRLWARVVQTEDPGGEFRQPIGEAHGNLGTLYLAGRGTTQDDARGVELLRKGVSLGDPGSMFYLGVCLVEGSAGLPRNITEGQSLIVRGAEGRHAGAQKYCRQNGLPFTVR